MDGLDCVLCWPLPSLLPCAVRGVPGEGAAQSLAARARGAVAARYSGEPVAGLCSCGQFSSAFLGGQPAAPGPRKQTYRTSRRKLCTASRVQTTIPANPDRRPRAGQDDSQIQSPTVMGRNNTQTMISTTEGSARTQFQSKSSHSRFTTSAMANPTHNIAKITTAYVPSTRGTVTLQNDESLTVTLLDLQDCQPEQERARP